jgi:hydroxymethylpyrimidine/phosphomethylpyrimidine kinase
MRSIKMGPILPKPSRVSPDSINPEFSYFPFSYTCTVAPPLIPPLILIFGPIDPSGSNGLPADAVTCARLGCHALSTVTALTVQDTAGVEDIEPVSSDLIDDQARCLPEDMAVQAIKIGGLYSAEAASVAAQIAADYNHVPLVLHLGQGADLTEDTTEPDADDLLEATLQLLLPQTEVVVVEHARLAQWQADGQIELGKASSAAHALLAAGAQWVLTLGAPVRASHRINLLIGPEGQTSSSPWQAPIERHGDVGGVLATALAAFLAQGLTAPQAVERALAHADAAVAASFPAGMGRRIPNRMTL